MQPVSCHACNLYRAMHATVRAMHAICIAVRYHAVGNSRRIVPCIMPSDRAPATKHVHSEEWGDKRSETTKTRASEPIYKCRSSNVTSSAGGKSGTGVRQERAGKQGIRKGWSFECRDRIGEAIGEGAAERRGEGRRGAAWLGGRTRSSGRLDRSAGPLLCSTASLGTLTQRPAPRQCPGRACGGTRACAARP